MKSHLFQNLFHSDTISTMKKIAEKAADILKVSLD